VRVHRRWVAATVVVALVGGYGVRQFVGPAGASTTQTAAAASPPADPLPLLEMTTGAGVHFYTLSRSEADAAVTRYGFRLWPTRTGYLRQASFDGSQPLYRLAKIGSAGWLVTASIGERDQLVASGRFRYEGVLGHAAARAQPATALLSRFSNGNEWRLALEAPYGDPAGLLAAGYRRDGPLGYVHPQWMRAGALYFGTWDADAHPSILRGGRTFYHRDYDDWWAGVRDYSGQDPSVPPYKGVWPDADFTDRKPAIGFYDDAQTATVEKHISQASSAGLDYFAFYWYWNPNRRGEVHNLGLESFLRAGNRGAMDFALTLCAHGWDNGALKIPTEQFGAVSTRLATTYLNQPNYLRANDGRRIVWLCDTRGIGSGSPTDVRAFVDTLRATTRAQLGAELLVLAHQDLGLRLDAVGADGDYCAAPYAAVANRSYASYVRGQRAGFARGSGTFVRCVMSNFDERPRYPIAKADASKVLYFPDQTFDLFTEAVRNVATDMANSTRTSVVDNFALFYAWNEWREGGYIEPNARDGCRYLDIVRTELKLTTGAGCAAG
jgi:hypothetical protein